jgi:hypothetical protein
MANELTRPASFAPQTFADAMAFCKMLATTSFVPAAFKGKPEEILAAVQFGAELGVGPMQALQNIAVINGKPSVYGDLALALVHASGKLAYIIENDDGECSTCTVRRVGDNPNEPAHTVEFSNEDAKRAGLFGKAGPWQQYPQRMRMFRARGFALRDKFPDVLKGLITREEAEDYPDVVGRDVEPPAVVASPQPAPPEAVQLVIPEAQKPTDKATAEQRKALRKMAADVMSGQGNGDTWLKSRMETMGIAKATDMTVMQVEALADELVAIRAQDDAVIESFDAEKQEPDVPF